MAAHDENGLKIQVKVKNQTFVCAIPLVVGLNVSVLPEQIVMCHRTPFVTFERIVRERGEVSVSMNHYSWRENNESMLHAYSWCSLFCSHCTRVLQPSLSMSIN